jgi:hypothetical protein
MDKMEILRMAFSKNADPEQALKLAREMAAFVSEDTGQANTISTPNQPSRPAIDQPRRRFNMTEIATRAGVSVSTVSRDAREHRLVGEDGLIDLDSYYKLRGEPPPAAPLTHARSISRKGKAWTPAECEAVAGLLDQGVSPKEAGRIHGRTSKAVQAAWRDGKLPTKHYKPNAGSQLGGAISAEKRGFQLTERTMKTLFGEGEKK